jgi:hypothetical protein
MGLEDYLGKAAMRKPAADSRAKRTHPWSPCLSTRLVALFVCAAMVALNYCGDLQETMCGEAFSSRFEHGWPWTWLERRSDSDLWPDGLVSWTAWKGEKVFWLSRLMGDMLIAAVFVVGVAIAWEGRVRYHGRALCTSLRELLGAVFVTAVLLKLLVADQARRNEECQLENRLDDRTSVIYDYAGPDVFRRLIRFARVPVLLRITEVCFANDNDMDDAKLAGLCADSVTFASCRDVNLYDTRVTDEGVQFIPSIFPAVEDLDLGSLEIGDKSVAGLRELRSLRRLSLAQTRVTDDSIPALLEIASLEELDVHETGITDDGLLKLSRSATLKKVSVGDTRVTHEAVAAIRIAKPDLVVEE